MTGPNTRTRVFWTTAEDRRLIIGYNRYWEERNLYRRIELDLRLGFAGHRSNVDFKDRIRVIYLNLKSYKGFFVPRNCRNPQEFIPEEHWASLQEEDSEIEVDLIPETERFPLNYLLYARSSVIHKILDVLEDLPEDLPEDPLLHLQTWGQICGFCFTGRNKLTKNEMNNLLNDLLAHGYIRAWKTGIRTFIFKSQNR